MKDEPVVVGVVFDFRILADPSIPPDEIHVRDEQGRTLHVQKIHPSKGAPDGG